MKAVYMPRPGFSEDPLPWELTLTMSLLLSVLAQAMHRKGLGSHENYLGFIFSPSGYNLIPTQEKGR